MRPEQPLTPQEHPSVTDLLFKTEQQLGLIAQQLRQVTTAEGLVRFVRADLQTLLPHKAMICGLGHVSTHGVLPLHILAWNYPMSYIRPMLSHDGHIQSPLIQAWLAAGTPQVHNVDDLQAQHEHGEWVENIRKHALRNVIVYGQRDLIGDAASCFTFMDIAGRAGACHAVIVELLVPHLHRALCRIWNRDHRGILPPAAPTLSAREATILQRMYNGKTNKEIAEALSISHMTVKNHAKNIFAKLGARNRCEAIAKGLRLQLVRIGDDSASDIPATEQLLVAAGALPFASRA